jgi:hypothetical protein
MTITTVHVKEITMAAPDIICLRVRDQEVVNGPLINHGSPDPSGVGGPVNRVDPTDGLTKPCLIVGKNADYYKFYDVLPTAFLDRTAATTPGNYGTIGGQTVTTIFIQSLPFDEGACGNYTNVAPMEHVIYLKLSGNLPQGGQLLLLEIPFLRRPLPLMIKQPEQSF